MIVGSVPNGDEADVTAAIDAASKALDEWKGLAAIQRARILRSAADAEEVVQQSWLQVWKGAAGYDPRRGTVAAWLLTVARSRSLDLYRSVASRRRAEARVDPEPLSPPAPEAFLAK